MFTQEQFSELFQEYNRTFWPAAALLWVLSAGALVGVHKNPRLSPALTFLMGIMWLWSAFVYHIHLFTRIHSGAWLFGAFFAVQGLMLLREASTQKMDYIISTRVNGGALRSIGVGMIVYALFYPMLGLAKLQFAAPTYGVPCPTDILTIGLILTAREVPIVLQIIPSLWGIIGGSAIMLFAVKLDAPLFVAGAMLGALSVSQLIQKHTKQE